MSLSFRRPGQALLDDRFPLPLDGPFSTAQANACRISGRELSQLVREGLVVRLVPGAYAAAQVPDSLELRIAALKLVVPPGAVVTDRTAGWLHGAEHTLAPGDHRTVPLLSVFHRGRGCRLRNDLTASGQRMMRDSDVMEIGGVLVTTPLRTACDLGRLLRREQAFAALDAMLRLGAFDKEELAEAASGFKGYRWVRQLRGLVPLADARSQSPGESVVRLRWLDCPGVPPPDLQRPVPAPGWVLGGLYFVDLGVDEIRFGLEYDGERFHGPDRAQHDAERRAWISTEERWTLRVVGRHDLYGVRGRVEELVREGVRVARTAMRNSRIIF